MAREKLVGKIDKHIFVIMYIFFGVSFGGAAAFYRLLIQSDIPVSYTTGEALTVQILFCISTIFYLFASSSFKNKGNVRLALIFSVLFVYNIVILKLMTDASYYNSSTAQLQLASIVNSGIVMFFNYYLIAKRKSS